MRDSRIDGAEPGEGPGSLKFHTVNALTLQSSYYYAQSTYLCIYKLVGEYLIWETFTYRPSFQYSVGRS